MSHASETEEADLRDALYRSALESSKRGQLRTEPVSPQLESFLLHLSIELVLLSTADADTLVYIGAPPQQFDQTDEAYARIASHFVNFHKIHSKNVLCLGSAKLEELLGPSSQFRIERRLRNQGILPDGRPHGIKYLLDLRPPSEDDDAIFLITELSCSSGILTWFEAQKRYDIPRIMVCGQDDSSLLPNHSNNAIRARKQSKALKKSSDASQPSRAEPSTLQPLVNVGPSHSKESKPSRIGNWEGVFPAAPAIPDEVVDYEDDVHATANIGNNQEPSEPSPDAATNGASREQLDIQPEYSQLRHWSAIERLLHAIEGNDPMLDSAPKLWTYFAVANYFGCASHERVSGWITKWLFTAPNHNFIQCNPEVCYRIGLGIQSEVLIKDAFSLLVGEKALINLRREHSAVESFDLQVSVAGRKLGLLDEDELGRIDHAANIFIKRIQSGYDALIGQDMLWLQRSTVFGVLSNFVAHSRDEEEIAQQLKEYIKTFVRTRVIWALARDYKGDLPETEQAPESVRSFYPHASAQFSIYNELSEEERICSRFFWMVLRDEQFEMGDNGVFTPLPLLSGGSRLHSASLPVPGWSKLARKLQNVAAKHKLVMMQKDSLYASAAKFMDILGERYWNAPSKAEDRPDYSDHSRYPKRNVWKHAKKLVPEACSRMPTCGDATDDDCANENSAADTTLRHLESLYLSSPKRGHGADPTTDVAHKKRARLDLDHMRGNSEQGNGMRADLPIRAAASQNENNLVPLEEQMIIKVAKWQAVENPGSFGARFASVEREAPVDDGTKASSLKTDTARSLFVEPAQAREGKVKRRERLEPDGQHSFSIDKLLSEITQAMRGICDEALLAVHLFQDNEVPPTDLIDSLMCLNDPEWKCLPLWAGGNDDGSGGVYNDMEVPILEVGGFDGAKRGLGDKTKSSIAGSSSWSEILSTVGRASKEATDGTASETVTVQSLGDVDMDVRSLDEDSTVRDTEPVVSRGLDSVDNYGGGSEDQNEYYEDEDEGDHVVLLAEGDIDDVEEAGWDDCVV